MVLEGGEEFGVLAPAVAVAPDVDHLAVVEQPVDERGGHDPVGEDVPPLLEALVGGEDGGADLIAPVDELEEGCWSRLAACASSRKMMRWARVP